MTDLREHSGTTRTVCRVCGAPGAVRPFLSLGSLPMGNAFIAPKEISGEQQFPLDIGFCESCYLVQIVEPAPVSAIEKVYRNYSYVPTGATLERHYRALAADIVSTVTPRPDALFVDIGSNDGLLLRSVRAQAPNCGIVGVEPSPKISEIARGHGVPTINRFFDDAAADELLSLHGPADVISATQVLQHIRDPVRLLRSVDADAPAERRPRSRRSGRTSLMSPRRSRSTPSTTSSCSASPFTRSRTCSPRRVSWYSARRGATRTAGRLRVFAQKREGTREPLPSVAKTLSDEVRAGLDRFDAYARFGAQVEGLRTALRATVNDVRSSGQTISAYGAPSTGTTLLSYCGFGRDQIEYIVDDNPLKQGLVTPGSHIPITDSSALEQRPTDCVLILAWRLKDEILARLAPLRGSRIKSVIIPLPTPELVR